MPDADGALQFGRPRQLVPVHSGHTVYISFRTHGLNTVSGANGSGPGSTRS